MNRPDPVDPDPPLPATDEAPTAAEEEALDEALDETFPASDPPSQTDPTHGIKGTHPT